MFNNKHLQPLLSFFILLVGQLLDKKQVSNGTSLHGLPRPSAPPHVTRIMKFTGESRNKFRPATRAMRSSPREPQTAQETQIGHTGKGAAPP